MYMSSHTLQYSPLDLFHLILKTSPVRVDLIDHLATFSSYVIAEVVLVLEQSVPVVFENGLAGFLECGNLVFDSVAVCVSGFVPYSVTLNFIVSKFWRSVEQR